MALVLVHQHFFAGVVNLHVAQPGFGVFVQRLVPLLVVLYALQKVPESHVRAHAMIVRTVDFYFLRRIDTFFKDVNCKDATKKFSFARQWQWRNTTSGCFGCVGTGYLHRDDRFKGPSRRLQNHHRLFIVR